MAKQENIQKQELARELYVQGCTQTEIKERLSVSFPTLRSWIAAGDWDALKNVSQSTRSALLANAYEQLEAIDRAIKENGNIPTKTLNDAKSTALRQIEMFEDTPLRTYVDCFEALMKYVASNRPALKVEIGTLCQEFLVHIQSTYRQ